MSCATAHLSGKGDSLVGDVAEMVDCIGEWKAYLELDIEEEEKLRIGSHIQTGRPLGDDGFTETLEQMSGRFVKKRKPGAEPKKNRGN